jgi:peptidoglycan/LPS O-acetylase OafA/YrhL
MRFQALDGWRGLSAILVALFHIPVLTSFAALPFFRHSFLFVDFFFVLSGFVITFAYDDRVTERSGFFGFVIRRFGRLWPLHVFMLCAMIGLELVKLHLVQTYGGGDQAPFTGRHSVPLIFSNLALVQAARPEPLLSWNTPSWSISTEFWAYLLFALLRNAFGRYDKIVSAAIVLVSGVLIYGFSGRGMDVVAWLGFFRCLCGFFTGHLLFRLHQSAPLGEWRPFRSGWIATAVEAAAILAVVLFVSAAGRTDYGILAPLLFAAVIYVFASEAGVLSSLLRSPPFEILGRLSYSIYMLHAVLFQGLTGFANFIEKRRDAALTVTLSEGAGDLGEKTFIQFGNEGAMLLLTLLLLALVVAIAVLTYRYVENPSRRFFNRWAASIESRHVKPVEEPQRSPRSPQGVTAYSSRHR